MASASPSFLFAAVAVLLAGWLWLARGLAVLALVGAAAGGSALYRVVHCIGTGTPPSSE